MSKSIGMAIRITKDTRKKISVVNGGVVPGVEDELSYFVFPYDYDHHTFILPAYVFFESYRFANQERDDSFVDIDEV